jgi:ubiquinone/menaquinone biosynthesis C-methylase UbiE
MKIHGFKDTIAWYNSNAQLYSKNITSHPPIEDINKMISLLPQHTTVLDAGCAAGRDCQVFYDKQINIVGIDISKGLLEEARTNNPQIEFVEGNLLNLPFADTSFGGVYSHASLLHLETVEEVRKALQEYNRVLVPHGILYLYVKKNTTNQKFAIVNDILSGHDRFFQYFTLEEIDTLIKQAHFEKIELYESADPTGRKEVTWITCFAKKN